MQRATYQQVRLFLFSQDENNEIWVHLRAARDKHDMSTQLSAFGGHIHKKHANDPISAILDNVHKQGCGHFDGFVNHAQLMNPELTYSVSSVHQEITDIVHISNILVFATVIPHGQETLANSLHRIKLSYIKHYLADKQINPHRTFITEKLTLETESDNILHHIMPMMSYRLFKTPLYEPESREKGFFGKSLRADENCFIDEFINTLPVKGLITRHKIVDTADHTNRHTVRTSEVRIHRREKLTARGTGIYDRKLKKQHGVGKQYPESEKMAYTNFQSISYFSVENGTPVFGWDKDRSNRLLGIAEPDLLPNRLFIYDGGTVTRPYDSDSPYALSRYIHEKVYTEEKMFDTNDMPSFIKKVKAVGSNNHNEVLARIRWNTEKSSLCVFSDNIETRWIAINWANKVNKHIHTASDIALKNGLITDAEYKQFKEYKTPISFYYPNNKMTGFYSEAAIQQDIEHALTLFDNDAERNKLLDGCEFEFLLILNDAERIEKIIQHKVTMDSLFKSSPFVAEYLIEKHHEFTEKPYEIDENTFLKNMTRSWLQKISTGMLQGFKKNEEGKIILANYTFQNKDLSDMDLRQFVFEHCQFYEVLLKNARLDTRSFCNITLSNCDLSDTPIDHLDLSTTQIKDDLIYTSETLNLTLLEKMELHIAAKNLTLDQAMAIIHIKRESTPPAVIAIALYHTITTSPNTKHTNEILTYTGSSVIDGLVWRDSKGTTPLHIATNIDHKGHITTIIKFIPMDRRLDVLTIKDNTGNTPLHATSDEIAKIILDAIPKDQRLAALTTQNNNGDTPLHPNVIYPPRQLTIMNTIPKHQWFSVLTIPNINGDTMLHFSKSYEMEEILNALSDDQKIAALKTPNKIGNNPFYIIAYGYGYFNDSFIFSVMRLISSDDHKLALLRLKNENNDTLLEILFNRIINRPSNNIDDVRKIIDVIPDKHRLAIFTDRDKTGTALIHFVKSNRATQDLAIDYLKNAFNETQLSEFKNQYTKSYNASYWNYARSFFASTLITKLKDQSPESQWKMILTAYFSDKDPIATKTLDEIIFNSTKREENTPDSSPPQNGAAPTISN